MGVTGSICKCLKRRPKDQDDDYGINDDGEAASKIMNSALLVGLIASKLPANDLLTLRQTCKMWNFTFIPNIRKIHTPISLVVPGASMWRWGYNLTDYLDQFQNRATDSEEELPFSHYILKSGDNAVFHRLGRRVTLDLISNVGISITRLELEWWCGWNMGPTVDYKKLIFEGTPNLEELTLVGEYSGEYTSRAPQPEPGAVKILQKLKRFTAIYFNNESFAVFTKDIVKQASELSYLKLGEYMGFPLPLLSGLQDSDHADKLKTLRVSLVNAAVLKMLASLAQIGLRLQSVHLNLEFDPPELDQEHQREATRHFHFFLLNQGATLRKLKISTNCDTWCDFDGSALADHKLELEPFFLIPPMKRLHTLKLECDEFGFLKLKVGGGASSFEETFPALRRFVVYPIWTIVNFVNATREYARAMTEFAHSQVTELDVYRILAEEVDEAARLALGFPAVTDLKFICWGYGRAWPLPEFARHLWPGLVTFNGCEIEECQSEQEGDDETDP